MLELEQIIKKQEELLILNELSKNVLELREQMKKTVKILLESKNKSNEI